MEQGHAEIDVSGEGHAQLHEQPYQPGVVIGHGVVVVPVEQLTDGGVGVPGQNAGIAGKHQISQINHRHSGKYTPKRPLCVLPLPGFTPQRQSSQHTPENLVSHAEAAQQVHDEIQPVLHGSWFVDFVVAQCRGEGEQPREYPQGRVVLSALPVVPQAQQCRRAAQKVHAVIGVRSGEGGQVSKPDVNEQRLHHHGCRRIPLFPYHFFTRFL